MWLPLTVLVLAGAVSADYQHGWEVGKEYSYLVRSRTFTGLDQLSDQFSGILIKALLTIQPKDSQTLRAKISKAQYAHVHKSLPGGVDSEISDRMLELRDLPISRKPFEIKSKHGVIRDLIVDREVPTWEVNILKSIVGQLQVDTLGENARRSRSMQVPEGEEPYAMFTAMEDSVGGKCEVAYDITPLPEHTLHSKPELVPMPSLKRDGQHIDIIKTKNFKNCDQRMNYHFGITGQTRWEPGSNDNGRFLSRSSTSRIVISGNLKRFTIQSSVTTSKMFVSPRVYDHQSGMVASRMNLTLVDVIKASNTLPSPSNPESTGNLVYIYNNPFSDSDDRKSRLPSVSPNSRENSVSGVNSIGSSDELRRNGEKPFGSSSISSSEEGNFWQPKPTLEDAPEDPLLPYFVGYRGKTIGKSNEINLVQITQDLIRQIAQDLEDPSSIPDQETLEKFTILSRLIRTMSMKQIAEIERDMQFSSNELRSKDKSQVKKQNAWAVFRDAVAQAGTGPALITIKDWIEKKKIEGLEAADVVSRIPKNARTPTVEYTKTFFELASDPEVMKEKFLNTAAILAFTDLVRLSQISNSSIHNRYPVHAYGRLASKHDQTVLQEYIPFLSRELKKAIKEGDSPKTQTYILALGNIGHPKILSVFEPYLEGKEPVSTFQRTMMVGSMKRLAQLNPRVARPVLYKIYLNTMEAHEVRCMAVYLLMMTNPSVSMLQRMADFTNYDTNKHVNSAVKSTIESIAELGNPELKDLVKKARAARNLLTKRVSNFQYSRGYITDGYMEEQNLAYHLIMNYIGSDDSIIPQAWYVGLGTSYGDVHAPTAEAAGMVSSVKALFDMYLGKRDDDKDSSRKSAAEKIADALNIEPEDPIKVEGNLLWNTKYDTRFLPYDQRTIQKVAELAMKHLKSMKDDDFFNVNKITSYDITLSFPTETGLPFVYTLKTPTLMKISATSGVEMRSDLSVRAKSEFRVLFSKKVQGRIGFITPFEHQHFIAGIDMNFQGYLPLKLEVDANTPKKSLQVKVWPLKGEEKARLMHYSVVPYTSNHDILNLRPLLSDKNTHKVHTQEPDSISELIPSKKVTVLKVDVEADDFTDIPGFDLESKDLLAQLVFPWSQDNNKYRKVDLFSNLEREQKEPVTFMVSYDSKNMESGTENLGDWSSTAKAVKPSEKTSEGRMEQFLKEATKGIKSARSRVVDLKFMTPGDYESRNALTLAWANSNVEEKSRALLYWNFDFPKQDVKHEVCVAGQSTSTPTNLLDFEKAVSTKTKQDMNVDVRYGRTCFDDGQISITGEAKQTKELRDKIERSQVAKACREQMKQGNKVLRACQKAIAATTVIDEMDLSVDLHSKPIQLIANRVVSIVKDMASSDVRVDALNPKNYGKEKIDIKMKISKDLDKADVTVHTSVMDVTFPDIELAQLGDDPEIMLSASDSMDVKKLPEEQFQSSCALDTTQAQTFDDQTYPLRLGKCWHVVMTTYARQNPENRDKNLRVPNDRRLSILAREDDNGKKEVKIMLGDTEIRLSPEPQTEVAVNGQKIRLTIEKSHQEKRDDELIYEIFRLEDKSIRLMSDKYDVDIAYDGKRLLIKASDRYRQSVRGLCGDFDGDSQNDFTSPKKCMLRRPEEFIATYALTKDECEGPSLENARKADKFECIRQSRRMSNVISDQESGRTIDDRGNWGYHKGQQRQDDRSCNTYRTRVEMVDEKVCFTIRPVPSCASHCSPTETKAKNYQFHCMPKNNASLEMKKRVEKGANPDLSQKLVSMARSIDVPLQCRA